ncbi:MAG: polysaccharide pyruvyl transferase CsaB [Ruminococcaceae bacterium]|nr:polysaccharide pyruvyl transferase CsaB [Oscillospiraceae bacterium]
MSDIIISGYYGLGNSGDEALLESIVSDLKSINPDITITALSADAKQTKERYGIKTVNRFNIFSIIREFRSAKLLLSGGGTLIQDATSTKSLLYYLGIISLAEKMGLKTMLYANGMGPISDKNVKKVRRVLNKTDLITLRENVSLEEIQRCNITKPKVMVTADPAFNLIASDDKKAQEIFSRYSIGADSKTIAVSVRESRNAPENFEENLAKALDEVAKKGYTPVFIPMQRALDLDISLRIASKMKEESKVLDSEISVCDMLALIGRCSIAVGMRLHMLIFASVMDVPMAGIAYDPKVKGFMEYMHQKNYVELDEFGFENFLKVLEEVLENSDLLRSQLEKELIPIREKAKENAFLALELLKK